MVEYCHKKRKSFSGVLADGRIIFVDGVSRLKYINVRDWSIHSANPEVEENLKAPEGAKYIELINNRIYLANFPDSPNLVCVSMINRTGAKYLDFHDRFYSPNIATYDSRNYTNHWYYQIYREQCGYLARRWNEYL